MGAHGRGFDVSVVAVANQKGGVGKTTTTVNLAAAAAEMGRRTLVIDADAQANATSALGADASGAHIYDALLGEIPLNQCIVPTAWAALDLAPSSMDLVAAELELAGRPQREFVLRGALSAVAARYDLILIDCGPSLGLMTLNALVASDAAIAPVQCEYLALEGLSALLETIRRVQMHLHPGLQLLGVVATMYDGRTRLSQDVATQLKEHISSTFETIIPRSIRLSEAPSHQRPIIDYAPRSRGAEAYRELAGELLLRLSEMPSSRLYANRVGDGALT